MPTPCIQASEIAIIKTQVWFLQQNHIDSMEMMKEIKDDVKEIKKYIFEGGMDSKYASKETVDKHDVILGRVTWALISWLVTMVIGLIIFIWSIYHK